MKKPVKGLVVLGLVATGCAVLGYKILVNDTAKESVARCARTVEQGVSQVLRVVSSGDTSDHKQEAALNRQRTAEQWANLGY